MKKETILVLLYPGCIGFELALATELLSTKYQVITATPDGKDIPDMSGLPVKTLTSYVQISLDNCKAVLVPGGDPTSVIDNKETDRILQDAQKRGLLIGGICAGPSVLAKAGILKGKKIAHGYEEAQLKKLKDLFRDVTLSSDLFVADGNILTAKPQAHIEFGVEIASRLDAIDASKAGRLKDYYRGASIQRARPIALALLQNKKGQFLVYKGFDTVKKQTFYRPLGGGIDFHEAGEEAVVREIEEELGLKIKVDQLVTILENIFTYQGKPEHEIAMMFSAHFEDPSKHDLPDLDLVESGKVINKAVWKSLADVESEGARIYPHGIEKFLRPSL